MNMKCRHVHKENNQIPYFLINNQISKIPYTVAVQALVNYFLPEQGKWEFLT
jgi:hypothetical protein